MIDLGSKQKPDSSKPRHEVDDLLNRGGTVGVIRYLGKRAFTSWVSYIVLATLIMGFGVSRSDSENISGKLINFDFFGAFKKAGEVAEVKTEGGFKNEVANIHPIYKGAFAKDFEDEMTYTLSRKAKFKTLNGVEVLISKKTYGVAQFTSAANNCSYDFGPKFYPVSTANLKLKISGQRSWAGGVRYKCITKIEYLN